VSTEASHITVSDIQVDVVRKDIKNAHLAVYPPTGRVRIAAPLRMTDQSIRLLAISKIAWIRKHQRHINAQPRETPREYVNGESHYYQGRRYLLRIVEESGKHKVELKNGRHMVLHVHPGASIQSRDRVVREWYRERVKALAAPLFTKWEKELGVHAAEWGVKVMRTKWGSCNVKAARVWLNLELAKKPHRCLDYIVLHELVHLLEHTHNERFVALMDKHMPKWKAHKKELNALPVRFEEWGC
jgi:predicted metal-dependent hydrolase